MPNRIPPTANTPIQVTVQPSLTGSGQTVTLGKLNNGGNNGDFTIGGGATQSITATTTVSLQGTTQTAPTGGPNVGPGGGNAGLLQLVATVGGQNAVQSNGFTVAAIPLNWTDGYSQSFMVASPLIFQGMPYVGLQVFDIWASDSGDIADLGAVQIEEQVQETLTTGTLLNEPDITSGYFYANAFTSDDHCLSSNVLTGPGAGAGTEFLNQAHVFRDFRTGVENIPMANTGFQLGYAITYNYVNLGWQLNVTEAGAGVLANGYSSFAGTAVPNTATPNLITVTVQ